MDKAQQAVYEDDANFIPSHEFDLKQRVEVTWGAARVFLYRRPEDDGAGSGGGAEANDGPRTVGSSVSTR